MDYNVTDAETRFSVLHTSIGTFVMTVLADAAKQISVLQAEVDSLKIENDRLKLENHGKEPNGN